MKIETGKPTKEGRYACFLGDWKVPTYIGWWFEGRWFVNDGTLLPSRPITAFIGPLPEIARDSKPTMEFDL